MSCGAYGPYGGNDSAWSVLPVSANSACHWSSFLSHKRFWTDCLRNQVRPAFNSPWDRHPWECFWNCQCKDEEVHYGRMGVSGLPGRVYPVDPQTDPSNLHPQSIFPSQRLRGAKERVVISPSKYYDSPQLSPWPLKISCFLSMYSLDVFLLLTATIPMAIEAYCITTLWTGWRQCLAKKCWYAIDKMIQVTSCRENCIWVVPPDLCCCAPCRWMLRHWQYKGMQQWNKRISGSLLHQMAWKTIAWKWLHIQMHCPVCLLPMRDEQLYVAGC